MLIVSYKCLFFNTYATERIFVFVFSCYSVMSLAKVVERIMEFGKPIDDFLWKCFGSLMEASIRLKEVREENEEQSEEDEEDEDNDSDEIEDDEV